MRAICCKSLNLIIEDQEGFDLSIGEPEAYEFSIGEVIHLGGEQYTGSYEWTPSRARQIIPISGKQASANIVINPIPNNYGLVTYNGSTITIT